MEVAENVSFLHIPSLYLAPYTMHTLLTTLPLTSLRIHTLYTLQVKKQTDKYKGAGILAREILTKYELPQSFSPPYDPSLQMGALKIEKCRAMDSKKVSQRLRS